MAEEIRKRRLHGINEPSVELVTYDPIGRQWVQRFLQRHPELKSIMGKCIELARVKESTPEVIEHWFTILRQTIDEEKITWENVYNADESGFGIGKKRATHVIIDTELKEVYQAEPGRQEWVTVMEYVCVDGSFIPPLIIFKGENLYRNWIPMDAPKDWHVSYNTKGWTSNMHGLEWLKKCFEPTTREKADGQKRLLICDSHDSHISTDFIYHCIQNDIILMLLPPHASHLMQPLDVGVFAPLKYAMAGFLDRLFRTGIKTLQKIEWFECFIKAHEKAVTYSNIQGGWRGSGIYPLNPLKVLQKLPAPKKKSVTVTPSEIDPTTTLSFDKLLLEDSPTDPVILRSANQALKEILIINQPLNTPARKYIPRLAAMVEHLLAENTLLQYEIKRCTDVLGARKTRQGGKRMILDGAVVISTEEFYLAVKAAEEATKKKKKTPSGKPRGRPRKNEPKIPILVVEESEEESEILE
jgi:hypothetical protein